MDTYAIQSTAALVKRRRRTVDRRHHGWAFTMVELLLALAVTALVSVGVAAMLVAVSYGTSSKRDLRSVVVKSRLLDARLSAAIRSSRAILEAGTDYLVLWAGDVNTNGTPDQPDLSEMRLVERDASADEMKSYAFPSSWTQAQIDAADVAYQLSGNPPGFFLNATAQAKTAGSFQPTLWVTDVTSNGYTLDDTDPATTRLVSYRLRITAGDLSETMVGAAATRYEALNDN